MAKKQATPADVSDVSDPTDQSDLSDLSETADVSPVPCSGVWMVCCPALGGSPLRVEAATEAEAGAAFRQLCDGLDPSARLSIQPV
jgi:hypothetical protein